MPRTNARGRSRAQGRGQFFEAESETEDKILASRPACPRGLNITGSIVCRSLGGEIIYELSHAEKPIHKARSLVVDY